MERALSTSWPEIINIIIINTINSAEISNIDNNTMQFQSSASMAWREYVERSAFVVAGLSVDGWAPRFKTHELIMQSGYFQYLYLSIDITCSIFSISTWCSSSSLITFSSVTRFSTLFLSLPVSRCLVELFSQQVNRCGNIQQKNSLVVLPLTELTSALNPDRKVRKGTTKQRMFFCNGKVDRIKHQMHQYKWKWQTFDIDSARPRTPLVWTNVAVGMSALCTLCTFCEQPTVAVSQ